MYQFIYWLKAIAAILITNSHYADIWPVSALAFGGHLGNCLFFLVSGFCLCNISDPFPRWYLKRVARIYPTLWLAIIFNILTGLFRVDTITAFIHCFFYPTWYHFISSIMVLYIVLFVVRKLQSKLGISTRHVLCASLLICAVVYVFFFDKSWYHVDRVEENWVRFQFWISMILGVHLREKYDSIEGTITSAEWAGAAIVFVAYFAAKVLVSRYEMLSSVQFLSPLLLVVLVYRIALISIKLEKRGLFAALKKWNQPAKFLASITLEIYLVQNVIIRNLAALPFPANFIVVTALIVAVAWMVHIISEWLQKKICNLLKL